MKAQQRSHPHVAVQVLSVYLLYLDPKKLEIYLGLEYVIGKVLVLPKDGL
jgi:hypothetical protein